MFASLEPAMDDIADLDLFAALLAAKVLLLSVLVILFTEKRRQLRRLKEGLHSLEGRSVRAAGCSQSLRAGRRPAGPSPPRSARSPDRWT